MSQATPASAGSVPSRTRAVLVGLDVDVDATQFRASSYRLPGGSRVSLADSKPSDAQPARRHRCRAAGAALERPLRTAGPSSACHTNPHIATAATVACGSAISYTIQPGALVCGAAIGWRSAPQGSRGGGSLRACGQALGGRARGRRPASRRPASRHPACQAVSVRARAGGGHAGPRASEQPGCGRDRLGQRRRHWSAGGGGHGGWRATRLAVPRRD